jgi:hypothetical protein
VPPLPRDHDADIVVTFGEREGVVDIEQGVALLFLYSAG